MLLSTTALFVLTHPVRAQGVLAVSGPLTEIAPLSPAGEVQLEQPIGATRLSDGTVVVGDARLATVSFFDGKGARITTAGRRGAGPGEFNGLWWMGQCARDTVFAWDRANNRVTVIASGGQSLRDITPPLPAAASGRTAFATCSRSGHFGFVSLPTQMNPQQLIQRSPATVTVVSRNGDASSIGNGIASSEFVMRGGGGAPRPLGHTTTIALSGDRVYVGTGDSAAVLAFTPDGKPLSVVRVPLAVSRPVSEGQYDLAIDDLLLLAPPNAAGAIRSMMQELPRPERLPHYHGIHNDPSGNLWLVQAAPGDKTRLIGVDPTGRALGSVQLPEHIRVWEVGDDYVLGQRHNSNGEPFIVVYGLERRRR